MNIIKPTFFIETQINGEEILKHIEKVGRVCYKSEDKITDESSKKFVSDLIKRGHEAVIEHFNITVRVICDRGVTHEIVRHRIASYAQESTRYCNYSKNKFGNEITFIDTCFWNNKSLLNSPSNNEFGNNEQKYMIWLETMKFIEDKYMELIKLGATPQEARSILPNSLKTEIVMTMNLRDWRHFFKLRTAISAHPQMREIVVPMLEEFKKLIPIIFDDIVMQERVI